MENLKEHTILAINISTALKCHNSLNFNRREMIFFSKFASSKNLLNETKLVPVQSVDKTVFVDMSAVWHISTP